jgi:hypothetical protein
VAQAEHKARALLRQYGVGESVIGDRMLGTAAYGPAALTVPSPDGKAQHMVWATEAGGLEGAARGLLKRSGITKPTPEQLEASLSQIRSAGGERYATDEALLGQARAQQNVASQGFFQRMEAIEGFMDKAKGDEKFRAEMAPFMGFSPAPDPAPVGKPPPAEAAAAAATGSPAVNPEVDNWWTATQPELKDIPVLGGLPRWGLAALGAGTTAASAGLAYHLMAQGQQQSDPVAYAAAVQQMNAY